MGDEGQIRPDLETQVWNRRDSCCCSAQKKERKPRGEIKKKRRGKREEEEDESDFARGAKRRKAMMMLCSLEIPGNLTSKFFLNLMKKFVLFASNCTLNVVRVSSSHNLIMPLLIDGGCCFPFFFFVCEKKERNERDMREREKRYFLNTPVTTFFTKKNLGEREKV